MYEAMMISPLFESFPAYFEAKFTELPIAFADM